MHVCYTRLKRTNGLALYKRKILYRVFCVCLSVCVYTFVHVYTHTHTGAAEAGDPTHADGADGIQSGGREEENETHPC